MNQQQQQQPDAPASPHSHSGGTVAARRGDLAVIVVSRDGGTETVTLGRVTSINRDGTVTAVDEPFSSDSPPGSARLRPDPRRRLLVLSQSMVDTAAAMAAYRAHTWGPHRQIQPFDSVHAAREFLRPFRLPGS